MAPYLMKALLMDDRIKSVVADTWNWRTIVPWIVPPVVIPVLVVLLVAANVLYQHLR